MRPLLARLGACGDAEMEVTLRRALTLSVAMAERGQRYASPVATARVPSAIHSL